MMQTVHQLLCLPTPDTMEYLKTVFDASPIEINWSATYVEINTSVEAQEADEDRSYVAYAGTMDKFYDTATGASALVLPLISDDLAKRCFELRENAPSAFYGQHYFPHLVIKPIMPPLRPGRRGMIQSFATILASQREPLVFDSELVRPMEYSRAPMMDYYTTMSMASQSGSSPVQMSNARLW